MAESSQHSDRTVADGPGVALAHWPSHLRFWVVAVVILWLDLWSKHTIFATMQPDESRSVLGSIIEFRRSLNDGAVFGSFTGYTSVFIVASVFALLFVVYLFARSWCSQRTMHVALALILSGALGNLYDRAYMQADVARITYTSGELRSFIGTQVSEPGDAVLRIGDWPTGDNPRTFQGRKIAGVEMRRQGVVRDFIRFVPKFPAWVPKLGGMDVWPWVFNVADAALVVGVFLLLIASWFDDPGKAKPKES